MSMNYILVIKHEATWFSAGDCLLSDGRIRQCQPKVIHIVSFTIAQ